MVDNLQNKCERKTVQKNNKCICSIKATTER